MANGCGDCGCKPCLCGVGMEDKIEQELHEYIGNRHYSTDHIVDFIISRERKMLEKIEVPLQNYKKINEKEWSHWQRDSWDAIDSALKVISNLRGGK